MNPALAKLIALLTKASLRRTFRGARTVKGAILIVFSLFVLAWMIGPSIAVAISMKEVPGGSRVIDWAEPYLPIILLAFSVLLIFGPGGDAALSFAPAEVDFLFPAPFHRSQLLIYKVVKLLLGSLFLAVVFSLSFLMFVRSWLAGFTGLFLILVFAQLIALAVALAGQIVTEHAYTRARKFALYALLGLFAAGLAQMFFEAPIQSLPELVRSLRESWTGRVLLAPFEVFSHTMLAGTLFPDFVCWAAGALAIDLGLLALVLKLDADYIEGAAAVSQKVYERIQRARRGGGLAPTVSKSASRLKLPRLPWLGGAGPVAWRTILIAVRTSRVVIFLFLFLGAIIIALGLFLPNNPNAAALVPAINVGLLTYVTFIFGMQLPWAFRGDIDHIDFLKTLPVRPFAVAAGEMVGAVAVLATIQLVILAGMLIATPTGPGLTLAAATFLLPFDLLMLGVSNTLYLLYPVRTLRSATPDFQIFGRAMLSLLLQVLLAIPGLGLPAALGTLAYALTGEWSVVVAVAWLALVAEIPLVLFVLGLVFDRYDPSTETPV